MIGQVIAVTEHIAGSELLQAPVAGALFPSPSLWPSGSLWPGGPAQLSVVDLDEFDHDGGLLQIGTETGAYVVPEDAAEDGSGVLDLAFTLSGSYSAGEPVYEINPDGSLRKERWADVLEPDGEEVLRVRVPHTLYDRLPVGNRDPDIDLTEIVEFTQNGTDLVITDVIAKEPLVDISSAFYTTDPSADGSRLEMDGDGLRIVEDDGTTAVNLSDDEGLDLTASPAIAVLTRKVRWLDADVSKAEIYGQKPGANSGQLTLAAIPTTGPSALIVLNADTSQSQLEITADDVFFGNATLHISDGSQIDVGWQDWTPTLTGWSANPTDTSYRYVQIGKLVHVQIRQATNGTSNATTKSITAPVTAATITNMRWDGPCAAVDNGTALAIPAKARIASAGTTISFDLDWTGTAGGWTASGGHRISTCALVYEAA